LILFLYKSSSLLIKNLYEVIFMEKYESKHMKKGNISVIVGSIITLIVGLAIAGLMNIFTGTLGGKVYSQMEDDIDEITNTTIQGYVKASAVASFEAQADTAEQLPVIGMAVTISLVMLVILNMGNVGGMGGGYRGSAL
jgi:hypothetical protein